MLWFSLGVGNSLDFDIFSFYTFFLRWSLCICKAIPWSWSAIAFVPMIMYRNLDVLFRLFVLIAKHDAPALGLRLFPFFFASPLLPFLFTRPHRATAHMNVFFHDTNWLNYAFPDLVPLCQTRTYKYINMFIRISLPTPKPEGFNVFWISWDYPSDRMPHCSTMCLTWHSHQLLVVLLCFVNKWGYTVPHVQRGIPRTHAKERQGTLWSADGTCSDGLQGRVRHGFMDGRNLTLVYFPFRFYIVDKCG